MYDVFLISHLIQNYANKNKVAFEKISSYFENLVFLFKRKQQIYVTDSLQHGAITRIVLIIVLWLQKVTTK